MAGGDVWIFLPCLGAMACRVESKSGAGRYRACGEPGQLLPRRGLSWRRVLAVITWALRSTGSQASARERRLTASRGFARLRRIRPQRSMSFCNVSSQPLYPSLVQRRGCRLRLKKIAGILDPVVWRCSVRIHLSEDKTGCESTHDAHQLGVPNQNLVFRVLLQFADNARAEV